MAADFLTKALTDQKHSKCRAISGMTAKEIFESENLIHGKVMSNRSADNTCNHVKGVPGKRGVLEPNLGTSMDKSKNQYSTKQRTNQNGDLIKFGSHPIR